MKGERCLATYAFQRSVSLWVKSWRTWARWQAAEDTRIKIELRAVYSINHFSRQTLEVLVGVLIAVGREEREGGGRGHERKWEGEQQRQGKAERNRRQRLCLGFICFASFLGREGWIELLCPIPWRHRHGILAMSGEGWENRDPTAQSLLLEELCARKRTGQLGSTHSQRAFAPCRERRAVFPSPLSAPAVTTRYHNWCLIWCLFQVPRQSARPSSMLLTNVYLFYYRADSNALSLFGCECVPQTRLWASQGLPSSAFQAHSRCLQCWA